MKKPTMEEIVSLAKRRGFIYPGSEIYGGLAGTYDYGPLGVALKNNVKQLWWRMFVTDREDMYGIDAAILMNPRAWEASGHVSGFADPLVKCEECGEKYRADHLIASQDDYRSIQNQWSRRVDLAEKAIANMPGADLEQIKKMYDPLKESIEADPDITPMQKSAFLEIYIKVLNQSVERSNKKISALEEAISIIVELQKSQRYTGLVFQDYLDKYVSCPNCESSSRWAIPTAFNMMFSTQVGASEDAGAKTYLRPETAGGMFVNFKNVIDSFHPKLPFGLAQIGKAFRNEIAPRDFVFRSREFEQMEVEYFVRPQNWEASFEEWHGVMHAFAKAVGIRKEELHDTEIAPEDLAHYSKRTIDFEFDYPFGKKELWGIAYRTDFDLAAHENTSGVELKYQDEETKEKITPHVIEPSLGVDRTILAILVSAYDEDDLGGEKRAVLRLPKEIAPYRVAVSPLLKNKPELVAKAREVFMLLKKAGVSTIWDDNGNIGKRYRRQDEIGTPSCVVIDFDTLGENPELLDTVTVRDRDTGEQERVAISELLSKLSS